MFEGSIFGPFHTSGTPFSTYGPNMIKIPWSVVKLNSKLRPLAVEFYFQFQFWHVFLCDLHMHDHTNFQPNDPETGVTVPTDPFIRSGAPFLSSGWSADPETPKMAEPYFRLRFWWLILNWKAQSILVTIRLSRLVSEIFACDRQTDRQFRGLDQCRLDICHLGRLEQWCRDIFFIFLLYPFLGRLCRWHEYLIDLT